MSVSCVFSIDKIGTTPEDLAILREELQKAGFSTNVTDIKGDQYFSITCDPDHLAAVRNRGAGRKATLTDHTYREIYLWMHPADGSMGLTQAGVSARLRHEGTELSVRQIQRRIAEAKAGGWWNDSDLADTFSF